MKHSKLNPLKTDVCQDPVPNGGIVSTSVSTHSITINGFLIFHFLRLPCLFLKQDDRQDADTQMTNH